MDNIFTVSKPFVSILNFLGLFPLSFEGLTVKGKFVFKFRNVLPTAIALGIVCYFAVTSLLQKELLMSSNILSKALIAQTTADLVFVFILHIYQLSKQSEMKNFLLTIHRYDNQVSFFPKLIFFPISSFVSFTDDFNKSFNKLAPPKKMANCYSCFF